MKVELKKIQIYEKLSEETTAFYAEIFIDGKNCGYAKNEGHGGCTDYYPYPGFREKFEDAERYFETLPEIVYPSDQYGELRLSCTFENWIDYQLYIKEKDKSQKKINKSCERFICTKMPGGYKMYGGWTTIDKRKFTIRDMLQMANGKGRNTIQKTVDEIKAKGETILNTNLIGINL
jgi:hypothetical protein